MKTTSHLNRRGFLSATAAFAAAPALARASERDAEVIAREVRAEFLHAWSAYRKFAWGADEVQPISRKAKNFFIPDHSFGLSIIEALDTHYVMGNDSELEVSIEWLRKNMNFDVDGSVQMFEAVIRMVAGLVTGYYATGEKFLLDGARDLADRLLVCFAKSPSGAPYRYANLKTGAVSDPKSNLAEIGSNILEFGDLSRLTGDKKYLDASMKALKVVIDLRSSIDLLGTNFDVEKGQFIGVDDVAPDEPVDSFYEYLWGGWQMLGIQQCHDWYRTLTDAILKYKVEKIDGRTWFSTNNYQTGERIPPRQLSELAAFYAELVAKGGDRTVGEAFYDSWTDVLQKYELIPEVIDYSDLSIVEKRYWMRPEYVNSSFDLWFLTKKQKYRDTAYQYFQALKVNCRTPEGYSALTDITTRPMAQADYFPAYAFSENFKYLYLMFSDTKRFDGSKYYLNTEGKIMRGMVKA